MSVKKDTAAADVYSALITAALADESIRKGLRSADKGEVKQAIANAVGSREATDERVVAVQAITKDQWDSIRDVAGAFGNSQALN